MTMQNELKRIRDASNVAMTTLILQTGLKKEDILASEDAEQEVDLAIFFILQDFYRRTRELEVDSNLLFYTDWLDSLNIGDTVIVREQTQGTTDTYIYDL